MSTMRAAWRHPVTRFVLGTIAVLAVYAASWVWLLSVADG